MSIPPVKPMMNVRRSLVATLLAVTVFGVMMLAGTNLRAQSPQQQWVGDLPIMAGMTIEPELGFAFDSPGGRIVLVPAGADDVGGFLRHLTHSPFKSYATPGIRAGRMALFQGDRANDGQGFDGGCERARLGVLRNAGQERDPAPRRQQRRPFLVLAVHAHHLVRRQLLGAADRATMDKRSRGQELDVARRFGLDV